MEGMIYIRHGSSFDKGPIYHDGENIFFDFAIGSAKISSGKTVTNGQLIDIDGTVTNGLYIDNDGTMTTGIRLDGAAADGIVIAGTSSDNAIEITGVAQGAGILIDYTIPTATSYALHIDMDTALAAGDVEGMVLALTNTVNGINNFRAFTSDLTMGANCAGPYAGYFRVDIADATVTGLSAALGMELILSSVSGANGEAHGMTIDVACPDATSSPGSSSNKHSFIKLETWGNQTGENAWDDNANIFFLNGLTSGAGNIVSAQEQTLRINIEGTSRYLVLSSAENNLTLATTGGTSIAIGASTTGIALTGARTTGISMAGGASYNPIHIGVKSNTASQGLVLTGVQDDMGGIMVFCDDGGVDLTNSWTTSPIWTRYAITANQTSNTATGAYLQLKMVGNRTLTSCDYSAIKAYVECSGTVGLTTADIAPINVTLELGGNITNTSGTLAGINIDINTGSSYSITDTAVDSAGIIIRKTSGSTAAWPVGLKINDSGTTTAISVGICTTGLSITGATGNAIAIVTSGKFAMGVQGTGIPVTTAAPHTMQVHTKPAVALDDYTSSFGIRSRYEVSTAQTNIVTIHAVDGRFRPKANIGQGIFAGVCGYVEADSTLTYAGSADSVMAAGLFTVEMDTTVTLTSGRVIGVGIDSATNGSLDVSNATFTALRIWAGSGKEPWTYGITLADTVTGISIGACTTGISLTGVCADGILVSAAQTTAAIRISTANLVGLKSVWTSTTQLGQYVQGIKIEHTRSGNTQTSTGGWWGAQIVLNAGTGTELDKPCYVIHGVMKGSAGSSTQGNVARFETQSSGQVADLLFVSANAGSTVNGDIARFVAHVAPTRSILALQNGTVGSTPAALYIDADETMTNAIQISGATNITYLFNFNAAAGVIVADTNTPGAAATHKIKCRVGSTTFYLAGYADF